MNRLRLECHSVFMELYMKIKKIRKEHFNRLGIVPSHFHILKFISPVTPLLFRDQRRSRQGMQQHYHHY